MALLNEETARQKAQKMIDEAGIDGIVYATSWILQHENVESPDDIYLFHVRTERCTYMPGDKVPLFTRDGSPSDYVAPVVA